MRIDVPSKSRFVAGGVPSGNSTPTTTFAEPSPTNSQTRAPAGTVTISPPRFSSKQRSGSERDDSHVSSSSARTVSRDEALDARDEEEEDREDESSGKECCSGDENEWRSAGRDGRAALRSGREDQDRGTGRLESGSTFGAMGRGVACRRCR